jgi:predicted glycosyltransferase
LAALGLAAEDRLMLCLVGGGEDGASLSEAFAAAPLPPRSVGVILTGPLMPADVRARLAHAAAREPARLNVIEFLADPLPLIRRAERAVAMGGYNCVAELLCAGTPSLIVPRVRPRQEQWIRATRLAERGLVDVLHPDSLSPSAIGDWLARAPDEVPGAPVRDTLDFDGLSRIPVYLRRLLEAHLATLVDAEGVTI